jgi:hypothetical protein
VGEKIESLNIRHGWNMGKSHLMVSQYIVCCFDKVSAGFEQAAPYVRVAEAYRHQARPTVLATN